MRAVALVAALGLAAGLSACGGGGDGSDKDQVRDVAKLIATSDAAVCGKITASLLKKSFGGDKGTCEKSAKENKSAGTVGSVKVDGDKATAVIKAGGRSTTFKFVKDGGDWKADDFAS